VAKKSGKKVAKKVAKKAIPKKTQTDPGLAAIERHQRFLKKRAQLGGR